MADEHEAGLTRLYLRWAEEHSPRTRRHLRAEIARLFLRCVRGVGFDACGEIEQAAHAAYLEGWRELMQRNHDGLMRTARFQLTRPAPEVPRVTVEVDAE